MAASLIAARPVSRGARVLQDDPHHALHVRAAGGGVRDLLGNQQTEGTALLRGQRGILEGVQQHPLAQVAKRVLDVGCALLGFLLTWPVMLVAALAIRLDSEGPILFRQERTGAHGRPFTLLKFRSMRTDAEKETGPVWAIGADGVTRLDVDRVNTLVGWGEDPDGELYLLGLHDGVYRLVEAAGDVSG